MGSGVSQLLVGGSFAVFVRAELVDVDNFVLRLGVAAIDSPS